jgi:hypothetical protein
LLNGGLFTRDFLLEGIRDAPAWKRLDNAVLANVRDRLNALFVNFGKLRNPTEAETEKELIWPLLEALGWTEMLVQQNLSVKRRDDVPDALLFPNFEAKQKAMPLTAWQRARHGVCVVEAKRWNRPLDRADAGQRGEEGVPSTQMLRYLRRVDDVTNGGLRWGILTSGRHWRLYFRGALSRRSNSQPDRSNTLPRSISRKSSAIGPMRTSAMVVRRNTSITAICRCSSWARCTSASSNTG